MKGIKPEGDTSINNWLLEIRKAKGLIPEIRHITGDFQEIIIPHKLIVRESTERVN
jgi:hypothetical protein